MQVSICEHGCGRTSLDPEAVIEKMSVRARQNGNEESSFDGSIEACKYCRDSLHEQLKTMFAPARLYVRVEKQIESTKE